MQVKSSSHLFWYVGYGVIITLGYLYFRFPTASFTSYCERRIESTLNNTTCTIGKIRHSFPLSIEFDQLKFQKTTGEQQSTVVVNQIDMRPTMKFWNTFKISGELYSGTIRSTLKINRGDNSYKLTDLVLNELDLSEILKDQGIVNRKFEGKINSSGTYRAEWKSPTKGFGKVRVALTKGSFGLLQPVLSLSAIDFDQIVFDLSINEQLELQQGKLKGKNINTTFEGSVNVMDSFQESRIRLSGLLEPKREFLQTHPLEAKMVKQYAKRFRKDSLPFKMGGTLSNPTFRFSR